jgi:hypothetical protein
MKLVGAGGQAVNHFTYDASGAIASSTLPQLVLPRRYATSHLVVQNQSATLPMYLEFGSARATAAISNGVVTSITVTNAGFGFTYAPHIQIRGGGAGQYPGFLGCADPGSPSPSAPATAHCVMTGTAPNLSVASIVVDFGGSGYLAVPYVQILNDHKDPTGCADPSSGGGSGIQLAAAGGSYYLNGTVCPTDQIALFCSTGVGAKFTCKWTD